MSTAHERSLTEDIPVFAKLASSFCFPMANVDNDVTPSFRVTPSCILIVSLWLDVVLCPPINVLKLPTLTSVYLCE